MFLSLYRTQRLCTCLRVHKRAHRGSPHGTSLRYFVCKLRPGRGRRRESGLKDETGPRRNLLVRESNENLKRKSSRRNCGFLPTEDLIKSFFDVNIDKKLAKASENS